MRLFLAMCIIALFSPTCASRVQKGVVDASTSAPEAQAPRASPQKARSFRAIGRFESVGNELRCAWPGSALVARFRGTGVSAELQDFGKNYFQVVIDGKSTSTLRTDHEGMWRYPIARDLPSGEHEVILFKRTDAELGEIAVNDFYAEGEMLPPPPPSTRRIEFLGDSITVGSGIMGQGPYCSLTAEVQNHYETFATLTARNLSAEHRAVAWGGKTVSEIASFFDRTLPARPESRWDFSKDPPDVVVINLGTNNFALVDPGAPRFTTAYTSLLERVRHAYPQALIVAMLGPMLSDGYPPGRHSLSQARAYIKVSVDKVRAAGEKKVEFFEVPEQKHSDGLGCAFHPSPKTQKMVAEKLSTFLKEKMGW